MVITQEKLQNNILVLGYVGNNIHFMPIYDTLLINSYWSAIYEMPKVAEWAAIDLRHPIRSYIQFVKNLSFINKIVRKHSVNRLYFGDLNNLSCKYGSFYFNKKGIEICFYEEGTSHYRFIKHKLFSGPDWIARIIAILYDLFLFLPVGKFRFGHWNFVEDLPIVKIPYTVRYSLVPQYSESYDYQLINAGVLSEKTLELINRECAKLSGSQVLFLEQPIYELAAESEGIFLSLIEQCFLQMRNQTIVIKYHPREKKTIRNQIEDILNKHDIDFCIIGNDINIPAEIYLSHCHFSKMITFFSSTTMYNGYLYEKIKIDFLLTEFADACKKNNIELGPELIGMLEYYTKQN